MNLKNSVKLQLEQQGRNMLWLAGEMNKSVDGLRLGLERGTLKYNDLVLMIEVLAIRPEVLFAKGEGA